MQLAAWKASPTEYHPVRDLSEEELASHERFREPFCDAENRFMLFRILELNYQEWISCIRSLLSVGGSQKINSRLKLNQLLLNYLTISYSITQHFERSYKQKFRRQKKMMERYDAFFRRVQNSCWAFCFFQDFRNYVQHCELPIGAFSRHESHHKVEVSVTHEASLLLRDYKEWRKCALTTAHGTLDLIDLLQHYHVRMTQDYATFVAKSFYPLLTEAQQFYSRLTVEAQKAHPGYRMVFGELTSKEKEDGTNAVNISCLEVPNDVYAELGIKTK